MTENAKNATTKKTEREIVLEYYHQAISVNVGSKKGKYYNIINNGTVLGRGKSSKNAWTSAYHNL